MPTIYYCHFPKTGGSFSTAILRKLAGKKYNIKVLPHGENYSRHRNGILIANVRNPINVIQSVYSHGHFGLGHCIKKYNLKDFDDFFDNFTKNTMAPLNQIFCPGTFYRHIFNSNGQPYFHHIVRCEHIVEDLKKVLDKLGVEYTDEDFNLTDKEQNKFVYDTVFDELEKDNNSGKHKLERLNKVLMSEDKIQKARTLYKPYFDKFGY
jgi:hypothetical protein